MNICHAGLWLIPSSIPSPGTCMTHRFFSHGAPHHPTQTPLRLGLRENWQQFTLLVLINAFVGGMVGLERTVVPLIGEQEFGLTSKTAILSFIVSFGVTKALCNLFAARLSETWGRKTILILGWLVGLPVPFMIIWADHWWWINRLVVIFRISNLDRNSRVLRRPPKRRRITQSHACADDLIKSDSVSTPHAHAPRRCADWRVLCSPLFVRG